MSTWRSIGFIAVSAAFAIIGAWIGGEVYHRVVS